MDFLHVAWNQSTNQVQTVLNSVRSTYFNGIFTRDHPFNLKCGGGGYGFIRSRNIFPQRNTFCLDIIYFFYENKFFSGIKCFQNIFFSAHVRNRTIFPLKLLTEIVFPQKYSTEEKIAL